MAKKRKNFIREKRIYCGEEYLEVDIVAVTNMPEAGKGKKREEELLKEVTGGAKTDTQTVENINGREESDTENNPDNDGGQTEEETEE